jgi:hypothetical protein
MRCWRTGKPAINLLQLKIFARCEDFVARPLRLPRPDSSGRLAAASLPCGAGWQPAGGLPVRQAPVRTGAQRTSCPTKSTPSRGPSTRPAVGRWSRAKPRIHRGPGNRTPKRPQSGTFLSARCHADQNLVNAAVWKTTLQKLCIVGLFLFVITYQLRSSLETIHLARNLDYWVPFSVEPFSDRMESISSGIVSPDPIPKTISFNRYGPFHLLAVNHRPFHGMSAYLTQLWKHHPSIGPDPTFEILMRYGSSTPFRAWFLIPHCTCSTATVWQLLQLFVFPPVFCVLLAFFLLVRRPGALHIWAFSACLLAMSQLDLFRGGISFQWTANTMAWTGWFRLPATFYRAFVQNIWPAALVITASYVFPFSPAVRKWARYLALAFLVYCLVQSVLAVAWSEYYLPFVRVYEWLQRYRAPRLAVAFLAVASLSFLHRRSLGIVVFALAVLASSISYGPAPHLGAIREITLGSGPFDAGPYRLAAPTISAPLLSSTVVAPAFASVAILLLLAFELRRTKRLVSISLLLLLPPTLYVLGVLNGNVVLGVPWSYLVFVLLCAGSGLIGLCAYCHYLVRES